MRELALPARGALPNDPLFSHLLRTATVVKHVIIEDPEGGVKCNFTRLLSDICRMQCVLRQSLRKSLFRKDCNLLLESNQYVLILAPGNYEFVVAALSVLSIGGAFAPVATGLLLDELLYLQRLSRAVCILANEQNWQLAMECRKHADSQGMNITVLPIKCIYDSLESHASQEPLLHIDQGLTVAPQQPGLLLFTSGTSGPPKAVVHTRQWFYFIYTISSPSEVVLSHTPVHCATGLVTLLGSVLGGARTEIIPQNARAIWERLRQGGVTSLGGPPRFWVIMKSYFDNYIRNLPLQERGSYVESIQNLSHAVTRASMPEQTLLRTWRETFGRRLHVGYGITEIGSSVMRTTDNTDVNLECCIGRPLPGVSVKLSNGDYGEILVKKNVMFSHYLNDPEATSAAFDSDGFYKTGDVARCAGDDFIFEGRISTDFIRSRGLKIPIMQIEMQLLKLPFVSEGCVVALPDNSYGQRVAALIRLENSKPQTRTERCRIEPMDGCYLRDLRANLADLLPLYMLPTALRILRDSEEIPRTSSLKVSRKKVLEKYFAYLPSLALPPAVELLDENKSLDSRPRKAWDWAGLPRGEMH